MTTDILVAEYGKDAPDAAKFGVGASVPDSTFGNGCTISPDVEKATAARHDIALDPRMRDQR